MAKDCWADGGGKEGQKPQRKSEQKPKSKKKDKAKVEDVKSSDVAYKTDYIDDVYCCDFNLTENVNDTIVIYTDDCNFEVCSNHMIVNNAGDKAICSVGNNKIFRAENDYKVFLDSCATGMVIRNKNLVADIRKGAEVKIHPITDGAKSVMVGNLWGDLAHFGKVHYNPNARSNIISEGLLKLRGYSITREEDPEDAVIVTAPDGHITRFVRPVGETRWWCDFRQVEAVNMSTVEENMRKYTKREVEKAKEARELQEKMNFPAPNVMIEMVKRHMDNCPVTIQDIHRAMDIWGPSVAALKGKTTQQKSGFPREEEFLPRRLNPEPQALLVDLMMVDSEWYLFSRGKPNKLRQIDKILSKSTEEISKALKTQIKVHAIGGYKITDVYCDKEGGVYKAMSGIHCPELLYIKLRTDEWGKHVPEIERDVRTAKERIRSMIHSLPYRPCKQIKNSLVRIGATAINGEPEHGSYDQRSPREVFLNRRMDAKLDLRVAPGSYVQVTAHETDNSMKPRTLDAIALEPLRNNKGSYRFFLIESRRIVTADHFVKLPFTDTVISKLNAMADEDYKKKPVGPLQVSLGNKIIEDLQGEAANRVIVNVPQPPENDTHVTNEMLENRGEDAPAEVAITPTVASNYDVNDGADRHQAEVDRQVALEQPVAEEASQASVPLPLQRKVDHVAPDGVMMEPVVVQPREASVPLVNGTARPSPVKHGYSTRRNRVVDYGKLNKGITVGVVEKIHFALEYNCHMTMKQATTKFGSDVVSESGMKEMKQMLDMRVMDAIALEEARQLRKKGFKFTRTFMFYKDKYDIDGKLQKVKGRFVNMELKRNKHPHDFNKRKAGNAMAESINTTLADAADKGKQIAVIDVVGAYLHASAGNVKNYQTRISQTYCVS
jgi:hypothetical protein